MSFVIMHGLGVPMFFFRFLAGFAIGLTISHDWTCIIVTIRVSVAEMPAREPM